MKIGSCTAKPGSITDGKLKVATLPNGKVLRIPIKIAQGKVPGKIGFISGGMHGNELNGIELNHRFMEKFERDKHIEQLKGTIIFLPILNISGFHKKRRRISYDKHDLNRSFGPYTDEKTVSHQIATTLMEKIISRCDFGIDLHDSGTKNVLLPHSRIHKEDAAEGTHKLGSIFGTDIIMIRHGDPGMLATQARNKFGIPVLTVEVGGGMTLWDDFLTQGIQGIFNVLIYQDMLKGHIVMPKKQFFLEERRGHLSPIEGIARLFWRLGEEVKQNDIVAEIYNPIHGEHHVVRAEYCGIIFSRKLQAKVKKNEPLLMIMEREECCKGCIKPKGGCLKKTTVHPQRKGYQLKKALA